MELVRFPKLAPQHIPRRWPLKSVQVFLRHGHERSTHWDWLCHDRLRTVCRISRTQLTRYFIIESQDLSIKDSLFFFPNLDGEDLRQGPMW